MPHLLPALSSLVPAVANNQDDDKKSAPAYLYCKRKIYYFRYAFPANLRKSLGRAELRVSLQTSYLRIARFRARMLFAEIGNMILEGFMLDYKEIRRRMNILLSACWSRTTQIFQSVKTSLWESLTSRTTNSERLKSNYSCTVIHHNCLNRLRQNALLTCFVQVLSHEMSLLGKTICK